MNEIKNPFDLAKIATTIAALSRGIDWDSDKKGVNKNNTIEEVQCAMLDEVERIYIAGNGGEGELIKNALISCGVKNTVDLVATMKAADKLLQLTSDEQSAHKLSFKLKQYSEQDTKALGKLTETQKLTLISSKISDTEVTKIKNINNNKLDGQTPSDIWLYRKLNQQDTASTARPSGLIKYTKAANALTNFSIVIVENTGNVHAELALLKFFTEGILNGEFPNISNIYLGGRKRACSNCAKWIEHYKKVLTDSLKLHIPENCGRTETQNNDGECPSLPDSLIESNDGMKIALETARLKNLFGGKRIDQTLWEA